MSIVEKHVIYQLKLSPSLMAHKQFFEKGQAEFTDKELCVFYRELNSFALEIAKAIGKIETAPNVPTFAPKKVNSGCGKLRNPVLTCINTMDHAVTATEIMDDLGYKDCKLNRSRLTRALDELAHEGKIDVVKVAGELTRFMRKQEAILLV